MTSAKLSPQFIEEAGATCIYCGASVDLEAADIDGMRMIRCQNGRACAKREEAQIKDAGGEEA